VKDNGKNGKMTQKNISNNWGAFFVPPPAVESNLVVAKERLRQSTLRGQKISVRRLRKQPGFAGLRARPPVVAPLRPHLPWKSLGL
jgi:hypothetical protein